MSRTHIGKVCPPIALVTALLLGSLTGVVPLIGGCDSSAQADAAMPAGELNRQRKHEIRNRIKKIEQAMMRLPQTSPVQKVEYEKIRSEYKFAKINFEAKFRARLGDLTEDVYQKTLDRLAKIEKMTKRFPR